MPEPVTLTMLCEDVYDSALALLGESESLSETSDFEDRAPYLLTAFCREKLELDRQYREAMGLPKGSGIEKIFLELDDDFPLSEVFIGAASSFLAAMLISCEDNDLSRELYARCCESLDGIKAQCTQILGIKQVYPRF